MNPEIRLETSLGSLSFHNPFILASGPPTASGDLIRRAFSYGWAGAVTKTIKPDEMVIEEVSPRFSAWKDGEGDLLGFENIELLSRKNLSSWLDEISQISREYPDKRIIASIMAGPDENGWQHLARSVERAGAHAVELNFSCPHGMPEKGTGAIIGQQPGMVFALTRAVRESVQIPVIVKLTPNVTDIIPVAVAAEEGGADIISAINTVQCLMGVDIESFEPVPAVHGYSTYGGYSGPAVKPIGLRVVSQIARATSVPVMGIGGIMRWEDAAEYILAGASAVQVCTAVMWNGSGIVRDMIPGFARYLERKGYSCPEELRGKALARLTRHENLDRVNTVLPVPDTGESCNRCGKCVVACRDAGYAALSLTKQGISVDTGRCDRCSLCSLVCPRNCISLTGM